VEQTIFGKMPDGTPIELYRLTNDRIEAELISFGAGILSLHAPDRAGQRDDVLLGYPTLEGYVENHRSKGPFFFGSSIGRYANRIAQARFTLDGKQYTLPANNGRHCLHGGPGGFYNVVWRGEPIPNGVAFRYASKDGEQGFPGTIKVTVRFVLSGADLRMEYQAETDKPSVVNLTNHAYFNLTGSVRGQILGHELKLHASRFTPVDTQVIPTGELRSVAGTPLDFRKATPIGERIHGSYEQLTLANGYDHNFVLDDSSTNLKPAAELYDPGSGRVLEVLTTEPAIQFYSGNYLDGSAHGKNGKSYGQYTGLCLETQHFPDSPNQPSFPSTVLRPGETFKSTTIYRFSAR
jgi:aldose 1-epimerase